MKWENWKFPGCENFPWMQLLNFLWERFILVERDDFTVCAHLWYNPAWRANEWDPVFILVQKAVVFWNTWWSRWTPIRTDSISILRFGAWSVSFCLFIIFFNWSSVPFIDHQSLKALHKTCLFCLKKLFSEDTYYRSRKDKRNEWLPQLSTKLYLLSVKTIYSIFTEKWIRHKDAFHRNVKQCIKLL